MQLIKGTFEKTEALSIINEMVQSKIKFHEAKIENGLNEEDIKMRENRIKDLQNELSHLRKNIEISDNAKVILQCKIELN